MALAEDPRRQSEGLRPRLLALPSHPCMQIPRCITWPICLFLSPANLKTLTIKAAVELPTQPRTGTGVECEFAHAFEGVANLSSGEMTFMVVDSTAASNTDSNTLLNQNFYDILRGGQGEAVKMYVYDCCANNRNVAGTMGWAQLLVDLGIHKAVVSVFLQRYHSKNALDRGWVRIPSSLLSWPRRSLITLHNTAVPLFNHQFADMA